MSNNKSQNNESASGDILSSSHKAEEDRPVETVDLDRTELDGEPFDAPVRSTIENQPDYDALIVNLDGYEGPLDVLLDLARSQKVDIRKISMLALVEQYLLFIEAARRNNLELAADYLVMASWLAYLKTKLLLPQPEEDGQEPTADEMAARLAFQLQRLEAMRKSTEALFALPQLGQDIFTRGQPEGVRVVRTPEWQADLFELLKAYTTQRVASVDRDYKPEKPRVFSLEEARTRLGRILGMIPEWSELKALLPFSEIDAPASSVISGAFHASLELAKDGRIDLRQLNHFDPIYIRSRDSSQERPPPEGGDGEYVDNNIRPLSGAGSRPRNMTKKDTGTSIKSASPKTISESSEESQHEERAAQ